MGISEMKHLILSGALLAAGACVSAAPTPTGSQTSVPTQTQAANLAPAASTLVIDRLPASQSQGGNPRDPAIIKMIVIHTIGGPTCENGKVVYTTAPQSAVYWRDDFARRTDASIHYVVDREGKIAQQRDENRTAGHVSSEVDPAINQRSIGIELTNNGDGKDPFPDAQLAAVEELVDDIAVRYALGPGAIRTHAELDTRTFSCGGKDVPRKTDPGPLFPLERIKASVAMARR
jgi:N-acetyl-anhydromuramyl-L-alanine amidase AmpD